MHRDVWEYLWGFIKESDLFIAVRFLLLTLSTPPSSCWKILPLLSSCVD